MLFLQHLSLVQFKNYKHTDFTFQERVTGICGLNGVGKTNLLDAIYYLCFTKSYFSNTDAPLVHQGMQGFRVEGAFLQANDQKASVTAILRENGKKEIALNQEVYTRVSAHVGKFPAVMIAPDDINIITGPGEERRKMADALLCQLNADYLQQLMGYNKVMQQRNSLLKQMAEQQRKTDTLLEILDEQLADKGAFVAHTRYNLLIPYLQKATAHYHLIAGERDAIRLNYQSTLQTEQPLAQLKVAFKALLQQQRPKDLVLGRTTMGIHRDDLLFTIMEQPFKLAASQGQRKSLLFALKLTEFEMLQEAKGFPPILLLDDVFEKLDAERMTNLLREVCIEKKGQVFITDTHQQRLQASLEKINIPFGLIAL